MVFNESVSADSSSVYLPGSQQDIRRVSSEQTSQAGEGLVLHSDQTNQAGEGLVLHSDQTSPHTDCDLS
jgi:hypothetical protein